LKIPLYYLFLTIYKKLYAIFYIYFYETTRRAIGGNHPMEPLGKTQQIAIGSNHPMEPIGQTLRRAIGGNHPMKPLGQTPRIAIGGNHPMKPLGQPRELPSAALTLWNR